MFLAETDFDDNNDNSDFRRGGTNRAGNLDLNGGRYGNSGNAPRSASNRQLGMTIHDIEGDDDHDSGLPAFGSAGGIGTPSSSRARMLAQQREIQLKKRQSAMSSGGMIRSSVDVISSASPGPARKDNQFTPAVRQFSAPKALRDNSADAPVDQNSEFNRAARKSSGRPTVSRFSDDEGDEAAATGTERRRGQGETGSRGSGNGRSVSNRRVDDDNDDEEDRRGARDSRAREGRAAPVGRGRGRYDDDDDDEDGIDDYRRGVKDRDVGREKERGDRTRRDRDRGDRREGGRGRFDDDDDEEQEDYPSARRVGGGARDRVDRREDREQTRDGSRDRERDWDSRDTRDRESRSRAAAAATNSGGGGYDSRERDDRRDRDKRGDRSTARRDSRDREGRSREDRDLRDSRDDYDRPRGRGNDSGDRYDRDRDRDHSYDERDTRDSRDRDGGGRRWEAAPGAGSRDDVDREREREQRDREMGVPPARSLVPTPTPLNLSDMRTFLTTPIPRTAGIVQCYIRRNKSGTNKLFPVYMLYLKEGDRFLMASKKRPNNKTSNYLISMGEGDLSRDGANYLGKLRSNFVGTEFQVFDNGSNPKDKDPDEPTWTTGVHVRRELAAVMYAANVLGSRGPRKMQVSIPSVDENDRMITWPNGGQDDILTRMKDRNFRDLVYLINKPPRWNEQVGAYVLNFNGRVTMASVKNFQLVDPDEQNTVVLQFGRVGKDEFTMDLHWPMTPFQAFAITLSSFDSKIACD